MKHGLFNDVRGNVSSSRIAEYIIIFSILGFCLISILNGVDIGENTCALLKVFLYSIFGFELKKAIEFIGEKINVRK